MFSLNTLWHESGYEKRVTYYNHNYNNIFTTFENPKNSIFCSVAIKNSCTKEIRAKYPWSIESSRRWKNRSARLLCSSEPSQTVLFGSTLCPETHKRNDSFVFFFYFREIYEFSFYYDFIVVIFVFCLKANSSTPRSISFHFIVCIMSGLTRLFLSNNEIK